MQVRAPAKVNLHLGVGPLRDDGYHELRTVFCALSLADTLTASAREPGRGDALTLAVEGPESRGLPTGGRNLAVRAARLLAAHAGVPARARLVLRKEIPVAAGLAGGSADAAATLVACDALWGLGTPLEELAGLAAELGSDVPFALRGGVALGTGRGERLTPLTDPYRRHWAIAFGDGGLSTPRVYAELDRLRGEVSPTLAAATSPDAVLAALSDPDPGALGAALANDLQPAALALRRVLAATLAAGRRAGAVGAVVSGSGPSCAFLAASAADAASIAKALEPACRAVRTAYGPVPGAVPEVRATAGAPPVVPELT